MSNWDIQVESVRGVLNKTTDTAGKFEGEFKAYSNGLESAAKSAGTMAPGVKPKSGTPGPIAAALQEFADKTFDDLRYLPARAAASISGAAKATKEYVTGDLKMAANAQHDAIPDPQLPPVKAEGGKGK
ncbi:MULTISPECIES: DUF6507 family protein [unclassified Streptomyces]|uniref:DUF6507 family protein n=1 Tax=unclassified Streptomyces TaxID=2593676 RepID=UPI00068A5A9D|nr:MULTISPECIES: DUF6507 family protein [unclassified Streptomyces]MCH0557754.1 hypothetical protein [Streptomyces sp. MUM 16J]